MLGKLDVKMGEKNRDIDEIDDKLRKIISDIVDDENKVIIDTQVNFSFFEELKFDSIQIMQLILEVEEEFNVNFMGEKGAINAISDLESLKKWLWDRE